MPKCGLIMLHKDLQSDAELRERERERERGDRREIERGERREKEFFVLNFDKKVSSY
jgi:hypothetical protein